MKKYTLIVLNLLCISSVNYSQDFGYKTFDVGVEYKWASNSPDVGIQLAMNLEEHHSFILSGAFKTAWHPIPNSHNNEKGRGWGGGLGYRYYFSVLPKRVFLGVRGEIWSMGMYRTANTTAETVQVMIFQPNVELGYTGLINDMVFITPYISAGKQLTLSSEGDTFLYGNGFVTSFGLSVGWRF
jgi:hypothetical protein